MSGDQIRPWISCARPVQTRSQSDKVAASFVRLPFEPDGCNTPNPLSIGIRSESGENVAQPQTNSDVHTNSRTDRRFIVQTSFSTPRTGVLPGTMRV